MSEVKEWARNDLHGPDRSTDHTSFPPAEMMAASPFPLLLSSWVSVKALQWVLLCVGTATESKELQTEVRTAIWDQCEYPCSSGIIFSLAHFGTNPLTFPQRHSLLRLPEGSEDRGRWGSLETPRQLSRAPGRAERLHHNSEHSVCRNPRSLVSGGGDAGRRKQQTRRGPLSRAVGADISSQHPHAPSKAGGRRPKWDVDKRFKNCSEMPWPPPHPLPLKRTVRPPLERLVKGSGQAGVVKPPGDGLMDRWGSRPPGVCVGAASLPLLTPRLGSAHPGLSAAHQARVWAEGDAGSLIQTRLRSLQGKLHVVPQRRWGALHRGAWAPGMFPTPSVVRHHLHSLVLSLSFPASHADAEGPAEHQPTHGFAPTLGQPRSGDISVGCSLEDDRAAAQFRGLSLMLLASPATTEKIIKSDNLFITG